MVVLAVVVVVGVLVVASLICVVAVVVIVIVVFQVVVVVAVTTAAVPAQAAAAAAAVVVAVVAVVVVVVYGYITKKRRAHAMLRPKHCILQYFIMRPFEGQESRSGGQHLENIEFSMNKLKNDGGTKTSKKWYLALSRNLTSYFESGGPPGLPCARGFYLQMK